MTAEVMVITKEIADEMLKHNTNNYRKVKWDIVHKYARVMANGFWKNNGEAIVFDEDGTLKNGQHRLLAVLESGVSVTMLVVRGVSRDITTWDESRGRSITEKIKAEGMNLCSSTLGAVGMILNVFTKDVYIGNDEKMQYGWDHLNDLKKAELICSHGRSYGVMRKAPCIAAVYCAVVLGLMPDDDLDAFCTIVNTGLPKDGYVPDSALALRNTIVDGIAKPDGEGLYRGHMLNKPLFEVTWMAMNAFKEGRKPRRKYSPNGCCAKIIEQMKQKQEGKEEVA